MNKTKENLRRKIRRHRRVRRKVSGTADRPRLSVFRSSRHIYCQVIDDERGITIASASTLSPEIRAEIPGSGTVEAARAVGRTIAEKAIQLGVKAVVYDRGGFRYHGRIKALAEAAREVFKEAGEIGF